MRQAGGRHWECGAWPRTAAGGRRSRARAQRHTHARLPAGSFASRRRIIALGALDCALQLRFYR